MLTWLVAADQGLVMMYALPFSIVSVHPAVNKYFENEMWLLGDRGYFPWHDLEISPLN